ncbi:hypothetical protein ABK040_009845 [Willaertia magna]
MRRRNLLVLFIFLFVLLVSLQFFLLYLLNKYELSFVIPNSIQRHLSNKIGTDSTDSKKVELSEQEVLPENNELSKEIYFLIDFVDVNEVTKIQLLLQQVVEPSILEKNFIILLSNHLKSEEENLKNELRKSILGKIEVIFTDPLQKASTWNTFIVNNLPIDSIIIFIKNSIPIKFDFTKTLHSLQKFKMIGSVIINPKTDTICSVGWQIRLQNDISIVLIPHLFGFHLSIFEDYKISKKRLEEDKFIHFPSFNGIVMKRSVFIDELKGFDQRLQRDFDFDLMFRLQYKEMSNDKNNLDENNLDFKMGYINIFEENNLIKSYFENELNGNEYLLTSGNLENKNEMIETLIVDRWKNYLIQFYFYQLKLKNSIIYYSSPLSTHSGYAQEAINNVIPLEGKVMIQLQDQDQLFEDSKGIESFNYPLNIKNTLIRMRDIQWNEMIEKKLPIFSIYHTIIPKFECPTFSSYCIGRSMFETNSLPFSWVNVCNGVVNEVWVPSTFNLQTFRNAGVNRKKTIAIPEGIDTRLFRPNIVNSNYIPLPVYKIDIENNEGTFKFLSIFEWTERKGPEILLSAYLNTFTSKDNVVLYIKSYINRNTLNNKKVKDGEEGLRYIVDKTVEELKLKNQDLPSIVLLTNTIPYEDMPSFYRAFDSFVLPSRGEGWGRPYLEAMASELTVIGTKWSGNLDFMNDGNSYLIDYTMERVRESPYINKDYSGHEWAKPSTEHLGKLMRHVYENKAEAKQKAIQGRKDVLNNFDNGIVANKFIERLGVVEQYYQLLKTRNVK